MGLASRDPLAELWAARNHDLRGVNLGGWLLQERWMTGTNVTVPTLCCGRVPSPYFHPGVTLHARASNATSVSNATLVEGNEYDERLLSLDLRMHNATGMLHRLRDTFISRADFARIAADGMNAVRIPFGWWILVDTEEEAWPYIRGRGMGYLDDAVHWAAEFNISILLDMHGGVGSQNGKMTSGYESKAWKPADFDAARTAALLGKLAARYAHEPHIIGIELLNEPELPVGVLIDFYQRASDAVRAAGMPPERVAVVIQLYLYWHVITEGWGSFNWRLPSTRYPNLVYDLHLYYAFAGQIQGGDGVTLDALTSTASVETISLLNSLCGRPAFVGEWSLGVPLWSGVIPHELARLTTEEDRAWRRAFALRQIDAITRARRMGGFFWSWHTTSTESLWSIKSLLDEGLLTPNREWAAAPLPLVQEWELVEARRPE